LFPQPLDFGPASSKKGCSHVFILLAHSYRV